MRFSTTSILALLLLFATFPILAEKTEQGTEFIPIQHASFIIKSKEVVIHVDPTGSAAAYKTHARPDVILLTHAHYDHLDGALIKAIKKQTTIILGPEAAIKQLGEGSVMKNGGTKNLANVTLEAVPMYNLTKERLQFHPQGEGNGYVVTIKGERIYIAGDTEDIPEMRNLKNIKYAFVCMNLPYTMTEEQAASAVLAFRPGTVYPYHYRGKGGKSDINKFKRLVARDKSIKVKFLKWY